MKVAFGCDHAGYEGPGRPYRDVLVDYLKGKGHEVVDCGTASDASVDYPDFAEEVCLQVLHHDVDYGVLLCGAGIGMSIAANRHKGIRAALVVTPLMARLAREHNDANVICLGKRTLAVETCEELLDIFLNEPFDGGERHRRRVQKLG